MRRITLIVLATCILLSGCAAKDSYSTDTAGALQGGVLAVSEASAAGDPVAALARLDELQASLLDAYGAGSVTKPRFDGITAAIEQVRADLELAISQQVEVPKDEDKPDKPDEPDKPDKPDKPGED